MQIQSKLDTLMIKLYHSSIFKEIKRISIIVSGSSCIFISVCEEIMLKHPYKYETWY